MLLPEVFAVGLDFLLRRQVSLRAEIAVQLRHHEAGEWLPLEPLGE